MYHELNEISLKGLKGKPLKSYRMHVLEASPSHPYQVLGLSLNIYLFSSLPVLQITQSA